MTVCFVLWLPEAALAAGFGEGVVIGNGLRPSIAINDNGAAVAVWERPRTRPGRLLAATRSADGRWSRPRMIGKTRSTPAPRAVSIDVAIDRKGNVVVVWVHVTHDMPRREAVLTARRSTGRGWSRPRVLAIVTSPDPGVDRARRSVVRPRVELDGKGNAIAVWTRPSNAAESGTVVEAATMRASGTWLKPRMLGESDAHAVLDVAETGQAIVVWTAPGQAGISRAVMAATRPRGGPWSRPEVVSATDDEPGPAGEMYQPADLTQPNVALAESGRATVLWKRISRVKPGLPGRNRQQLQAATRGTAGRWSAPTTLDERVDGAAPALLGTSRGEVTAVWLRRIPTRFSFVRELRTAVHAQGVWSPQRRPIARAYILELTSLGVSASGHALTIVERGINVGGPQGIIRTRTEAYARTPDHAWSRPHPLERLSSRRWCQAGGVDVTRRGSGVAAWYCHVGDGRPRRVMSASFEPV